MDIQNKYKKLDHREHVLARPGMYIGSIEEDLQTTWVFDSETSKMVKKEVRITPGLYKIYDEILVNAIDHITRLKQLKATNPDVVPVKNIKINIDRETGLISVFNDGQGIEVEKHAEHGLWIPEMIFGHLLTSANYDDSEEKVIGGQNGIGAKACNIFSKQFTVETVDHVRCKLYKQEFRDNMTVIEPPKITACKKKPYTTITFLPDYARFKMSKLTDDMYALFMKRAYDVCALTESDINVWINDVKLEYKSFERYVDLYLGGKAEHPRFYEKINDRWEIIVSFTDQMGFEQISFVNGIWTMRGGKHVEYISNQVTTMVSDMVLKKRKDLQMKPAYIKNYLVIFVKCLISNPTFDSQTKDLLTTPVGKFGSKAEIPEKLIEKLYKSALVDKAVSLCNINETKQAKKTDGKKVNQLKGIDKLDDANWAGTAKSHECTLILTEGDSAKSMAIAGLTVVGRDRYGVFPLKGKLMNVKDLTPKRISDNEEITNIKKIMGLESGKEYQSVDGLRYGRIMALVDSDYDGSHIKGLLFNMFHTLWPSLLKIDGFLTTLLTPVIKTTKGNQVLSFYSVSEYENWQAKNDVKGWHIKYYKGLGTSKEKEAKEYFRELKIVNYEWKDDQVDGNSLDLAFNKKRADDRKSWLGGYDKRTVLDYAETRVTYDAFIHKDLIHFSNYDIERSIPSLCDGLKVSQRKVLFGCFKKNITSEIKVEQLTGYVSENSAYHHGEASLSGTIIGMAQDFIGSNNINLLKPNGQFGSRCAAGRNHASPRYIYTELFPITRMIFRKDDERVLTYRDDDGMLVEPDFYMPIIPMALVNGALGIGTGFSTNIPSYNPKELITILQRMLQGEALDELDVKPWYRDFTGTIVKNGPGKYQSVGTYERVNDMVVRITELPVGYWTEEFKTDLEAFVDSDPQIKKYESHYTTRKIDFLVHFANKEVCEKYLTHQDNGYTLLENQLKLISSKNLSTSNMYLFNQEGQIKKYESVMAIIKEFYAVRLGYYQLRKERKIAELQQESKVLRAKVRFIKDVISKEISIDSHTKKEIEAGLVIREYPSIDGSFDYLLRMPIYNMTSDKLAELEADHSKVLLLLEQITNKAINEIWMEELKELETEYDKYMAANELENSDDQDEKKKVVKTRKVTKKGT